jgi:hypothetical protein
MSCAWGSSRCGDFEDETAELIKRAKRISLAAILAGAIGAIGAIGASAGVPAGILDPGVEAFAFTFG